MRNFIQTLSNPLLFYADKNGNSVFRNFCFFKNTGCLYNLTFTKAQVGKVLEYRFELEKFLKPAYFLIPVALYFIFIHLKFNFWNFICFEFCWIFLTGVCRLVCSMLYSRRLVKSFGKYELVNFKPKLPRYKLDEYRANFNSKIVILVLVLALFFMPALFIKFAIRMNLGKIPKPQVVISLSKLYFSLYPKNEGVYDMRALAYYLNRNYKESINDYKQALEISDKHLSKKDYTRLANILFLENITSTPENAVDTFNDYATRKKMSVSEESQILWIKSLFRVENRLTESIIQDYNDLLSSLSKKDTRNQFYISSDKAYVLYLMGEYASAIEEYNILITFAENNREIYSKELQSLYAERGFARLKCYDRDGANADFKYSEIDLSEIAKYEPSFTKQEFVIDKF